MHLANKPLDALWHNQLATNDSITQTVCMQRIGVYSRATSILDLQVFFRKQRSCILSNLWLVKFYDKSSYNYKR